MEERKVIYGLVILAVVFGFLVVSLSHRIVDLEVEIVEKEVLIQHHINRFNVMEDWCHGEISDADTTPNPGTGLTG